jgi:hypothetical protein
VVEQMPCEGIGDEAPDGGVAGEVPGDLGGTSRPARARRVRAAAPAG